MERLERSDDVRNLSVKNVEYLIRRQSCGEDRWGGGGVGGELKSV